MKPNRNRLRVWVKKDSAVLYRYTHIIKEGWLEPQCQWSELSCDGTEIRWGWDDPCKEPFVINKDVFVEFSVGCLDKNDIEIFDGSRVSWMHEVFNAGKTITGIVKWHEPTAGFFIERDDVLGDTDSIGFYGGDALFQWEDLEVIGNIHEEKADQG